MDLLVAQPALTYEEIGQMLHVHKQSVMIVVNSDLFQAKLKERRAARQAAVDRSVLERIEGLAKISLDALEKKIKEQRVLLGLDEVRETAEMALRGLGFIQDGPKNSTATQINISLSREDLANARKLMSKDENGGTTIDVQPARTG